MACIIISTIISVACIIISTIISVACIIISTIISVACIIISTIIYLPIILAISTFIIAITLSIIVIIIIFFFFFFFIATFIIVIIIIIIIRSLVSSYLRSDTGFCFPGLSAVIVVTIATSVGMCVAAVGIFLIKRFDSSTSYCPWVGWVASPVRERCRLKWGGRMYVNKM